MSGLSVFYPIVPNITWLDRLLPLGIETVQLRIKDALPDEIGRQIRAGLAAARASGCQLIVNDYWQEALDAGADFVHLGQDDLAGADVVALKRADVRIGISTHSEDELEAALSAGPDYVALGPIYETKLKAMAWPPRGLDRIGQWKRRIGALPLVAIGGITPERAGAVLDAGADSVAVITDFMTAPHPEARVKLWLDWVHARQKKS